jgi:hypothetical protein
MKNRQSAKVRGVLRDVAREKHERLTLSVALNATRAFVADDAVAASYQTLDQYRSAVLKLLALGQESPQKGSV